MAEIEGRFLLEQENFVKLAVMRVLKELFYSPVAPPLYHWDPVRSKRQIAIVRAYPNRTEMVPCLVTDTEMADTSIASVSDELDHVIRNDDGSEKYRVYSGPMWVPGKVTVVTHEPLDREILTDTINSYLRFAARPIFAKNQIEYLALGAGDAGEDEIGGRRVFLGEVNFKCQTQYKAFIDMRVFNALQKINFKVDFKMAGEED